MASVERSSALRHSNSSPNMRHQDVIPRPSCAEAEASLTLYSSKRHALQKEHDDRVEDYACNICFEVAENAVVTSCGHLYCWGCLYQWLASPSQLACPICPMCKAGCDISSLTPIYGRGATGDQATKSTDHKLRTLSTSSQTKPKSILDQWLAPHIHPPTVPILSTGETPARPMARRSQPVMRQNKADLYPPRSPTHHPSLFGNTHPVRPSSAASHHITDYE